ncbi:MAG TPA: hypothetical protein VHQ87_07930, partial [Rhizobacter sp.]|nr:hypothetical protein [Rhizobacter sp.]
MASSLVQRVGDLLLGQEKRQRVRATQVLLTWLIDALLGVIAGFCVWAGLVGALPAALWTGLTLAGVSAFYLAVRSGFNLRFTSDPALTLPQGVFSVFSAISAYVMCGPVRGASLLALMLTLMFGMFALKPREVRGLSYFAVSLLGITMAASHVLWPVQFPAREEAVHFM